MNPTPPKKTAFFLLKAVNLSSLLAIFPFSLEIKLTQEHITFIEGEFAHASSSSSHYHPSKSVKNTGFYFNLHFIHFPLFPSAQLTWIGKESRRFFRALCQISKKKYSTAPHISVILMFLFNCWNYFPFFFK